MCSRSDGALSRVEETKNGRNGRMRDITLIQLVSDQAMPNLLAAMALTPQRIIHLCTTDMSAASERLRRAYKAAGLHSEVKLEHLSRMPRMPEVRSRVASVIKEELGCRCIVNFTGGTKLMAIGAYVAAMGVKAESIYVDTLEGVFLDGKTGTDITGLFEDGDKSLSSLMRKLRVDIIAISNGCERVTSGKNWEEFVPITNLLLGNKDLEEKAHEFADKILRGSPHKWKERERWNAEKLEEPVNPPGELRAEAVAVGIFEERGGKMYVSPDTPLKNFEETLKFFQGCWWEVAVASYLNDKGIYRDLRWSANVGARGSGGTDMEEDILAVDGANLLYVSCKRGGRGDALSRTLEEVAASARRIGGSHSEKIVALYRTQSGSHAIRLRNRAVELKIKIITGEEVRRWMLGEI